MRFGRYNYSYLFLRLGLGAVFLWIGIDIFRNPTNWIGFVPAALPLGLSRDAALQLNGLFDTIIGLLLITGQLPRLTALLATLHVAGVLLTNRIDAVLARDICLLGSSLALLAWPHHKSGKHHWWNRLIFWKGQPSSESSEE